MTCKTVYNANMNENQPITPEKPLRDAKGRMLAPLPGGAPKITTENARTLVNKRWENYRRAAVKRIVGEAQSVDLSISTGADAFALAASKQFVALLDTDKVKIADLERLGHIMAGKSGEESQRDHTPELLGKISMTAETLLEIAEAIETRRAANRDQARAIDATILGEQ